MLCFYLNNVLLFLFNTGIELGAFSESDEEELDEDALAKYLADLDLPVDVPVWYMPLNILAP